MACCVPHSSLSIYCDTFPVLIRFSQFIFKKREVDQWKICLKKPAHITCEMLVVLFPPPPLPLLFLLPPPSLPPFPPFPPPPPPLLLLTGTASLQQWCCGRGCRRDGRLIREMLPPSASTASTSTQPAKVSPKVFSRPMLLLLKCQYLLTELRMGQPCLNMLLLLGLL